MTIDSLLQPFQRFGVNLGLERIKNLLEILGNPQNKIPIIHVTGTNGKGSVCAYLSSILSTAGYKVGRYISPHLIAWTERISINGENIETATLENPSKIYDFKTFAFDKGYASDIINKWKNAKHYSE